MTVVKVNIAAARAGLAYKDATEGGIALCGVTYTKGTKKEISLTC